MSGNEEIPSDVRTEPSVEKAAEPIDSTSMCSTSGEVTKELKTVEESIVAASVVGDAKTSPSDIHSSDINVTRLACRRILEKANIRPLVESSWTGPPRASRNDLSIIAGEGSGEVKSDEDLLSALLIENNDAEASVADGNGRRDIHYQEDLFSQPFKYNRLMKATNLHCPFVWQKDLNINDYHDHDIDLMSTSEEMFEDTGFRFRSFIIHLVLCYHNFYKRNIADCIHHLDELDKMMIHSSKRATRDYLFNVINDALYHVIHSCRIYILETTNQKDRAIQILNKIISYDDMNKANQAGIMAIRANVYVEYGYQGVRNAVHYISRAVELDPENAFWHFMKGMFMGRLRRMEGGLLMPKNEEFEALRNAIDKREDAAFIAFTAEAYMETAKMAKKLYMEKVKRTDKDTERLLTSKLQELNEVAAKYFKESINLKPSSAHLLFRCGKGLINLPPPYQDVKKGYEFIRKGLDIAPDSGYGNHAMAIYIEKIEKDPVRAKEFLSTSVQKNNFQAHVDMTRIEFLESKDSQKLFDNLKRLLELYTEMPRRRKILAELVCYHLFVGDDLVEACFYMKKLIQLNSSSVDVINSHKSMILPISAPLPLSDLIFDQIKANLKDHRLADVSREVFKKYIQYLINEDITPQKIQDNVFSKLKRQIELGYKNKEMKPVDERVRKTQKRVHDANEFEADPCASENLSYLNFYKNDLKDVMAEKTHGEDAMMKMLRQMGQNPLPKHRSDDDESQDRGKGREDGDRGRRHSRERQKSRKHSVESFRSSHRRRRYRSPSTSSNSSSTSSSSSYSRSEDDRRGSRKHRRHRRDSSSTSRSSNRSFSGSSDHDSSDRYSRSRRRADRYRHHSSSSYDSKCSRNKHRRRRDSSSDVKSRHSKNKKRDRSASSSSTSQFESSDRTSCHRNQSKDEQKSDVKMKATAGNVNGKPTVETGEPSDCVPKAGGKQSVDAVQTQLDNLAINSRKSSRCSPQKIDSDLPKVRDVVGVETKGETSESQLTEQGTQSTKRSGKHREDREDSDRSVRTITSRTSGASRQTSKGGHESVRTNTSRRFKEGRSSRRPRSSSSSYSDASSRERSRSRRHNKSEKRRDRSFDSTERAVSEGSKKGSSGKKNRNKKNRDRNVEQERRTDSKKHSTKHGRRRKEYSSESGSDSCTSQRDCSASSKKVDRRRRSSSKESKHSNNDRRRRKENDETDHSSRS